MYLKLFLMARDVERLMGRADQAPYPQVERTMQGLRAVVERARLREDWTYEKRYSQMLHQYAADHAHERVEQRIHHDAQNARIRAAGAARLAARKGDAR